MDLGALARFGVWGWGLGLGLDLWVRVAFGVWVCGLSLGLRSGSNIWVQVCRGLYFSIPQHSCHQLSLSTVPCAASPPPALTAGKTDPICFSIHSLLSFSPQQPLCPGPAALCCLSGPMRERSSGAGLSAACSLSLHVPPDPSLRGHPCPAQRGSES